MMYVIANIKEDISINWVIVIKLYSARTKLKLKYESYGNY